jgi:protein-S-isoprenylcysteine O-methyltransferase Ste14
MNKSKKITGLFVNIITIIFLLEPVWMLLPFAGFFYGSVVNLDILMADSSTAWLTYFIFPAQTLFPLAIVLITIGFCIFLIGAFQIYTAKLLKKGLVTKGIYKKFRHPQYTGLIIFGIGFLLIWGRFVTYLLYATMIYLYYHLAKFEERLCEVEFKEQYDEYKKNTYFLFPGESLLIPIGSRFSQLIKNKMIRSITAYLVILAITIGAGFGILNIRKGLQNQLPVISHSIFTKQQKSMKIMMIQAFGECIKGMTPETYQAFINNLAYEPKFQSAFSKAIDMGANTLVGFSISRTMRQKKDYYNQNQYDFYFIAVKSNIEYRDNNFNEFRKNWQIKGAFEVDRADVLNIHATKNFIIGEVKKIIPANTKEIKNIKAYTDAFFYSFRQKVIPVYQLVEK